MKMLVFLQTAELDTVTNLDELIMAQVQIEQLQSGYMKRALPVPEWVEERLDELDREIKLRIQGDLKRRLKMAEAQRAGLKTAAEKRTELDAEIEALQKQLAS